MEQQTKIIDVISWWEKRRLLYNIVILIAIICLALIASDTLDNLGKLSILSLIWLFGANVFYTMSWAFEVLVFKQFGKFPFSENTRVIIFGLGVAFSGIWTFLSI